MFSDFFGLDILTDELMTIEAWIAVMPAALMAPGVSTPETLAPPTSPPCGYDLTGWWA
jgi:hypothetical protein